MIFFTSDAHFYHFNVIKYCNRPFATVEEMNEKLILNWNSAVSPEDTVYVLGDFSLAIRPVEIFTSRLNGTKYLVPGNHCWCHSYNKKARGEGKLQKWIDKYNECGWIVLPEQTTLDIPGVAIINLCHHPYTDPKDTHHDKYANWRPKDDGRWLLHGHSHSLTQTGIERRMIDCGVDAWDYKPVSIEEIKKIICQK